MMKEMPKTIALLSTVAALALAAAAATAQTQTQTDGQSQDDQSATEQYLLDEPAPEPADNAVEVPSATEDADSGSMPATGAEAETAQAPEAAQTDSASQQQETNEAEAEHAQAAGHNEPHVEDVAFSFEGPFGKFDEHQLQRGLQVYTEVCSACHGMKFVSIRSLAQEGGPHLPEDQVRAYAAEFTVTDRETGEDRPGEPTDFFPKSSLPNAPDLSLMAKARAGFHGPYGTGISQLFKGIGGPEYIVAILNGYTGHEVEQAGTTFYENTAFAGGRIAMPPPLADGQVDFADGHANDVHHMAEDVAAFLMWAAEPDMMDRKRSGFVAVFFLGFLSVLLYLTNKRVWAPHKGKKKSA